MQAIHLRVPRFLVVVVLLLLSSPWPTRGEPSTTSRPAGDASSGSEAVLSDRRLTFQSADGTVIIPLRVEGPTWTLRLQPRSLRSPDFRVLVSDDEGRLVEVAAPPASTYHGRVLELPDSQVVATIRDGAVSATIRSGTDLFAVEPIDQAQVPADGVSHTVLRIGPGEDFAPTVACGTPDPFLSEPAPLPGASGEVAGTGLKVADIAFDADFEFHMESGGTDGGSPDPTVDRIEALMAAVSMIYENETGIAYEITTIVVRTTDAGDPYSATLCYDGDLADIDTLLEQFAVRWSSLASPERFIQRDVAHLLTGKVLIGNCGCAFQGAFSGPDQAAGVCDDRFHYGLSRPGCVPGELCRQQALVAHEIGHGWSATHCDAQSICHSMCTVVGQCDGVCPPDPPILGSFSSGEIAAFRNRVACLADLGSAQVPPFEDDFPTTALDAAKWSYNNGAGASEAAENEPSPLFSLNLDSAGPETHRDDEIRSNLIKLANQTVAVAAMKTQHTGVEAGEGLVVEYWSMNKHWVELGRVVSDGLNQSVFSTFGALLPADALHDAFRLRLRTEGDEADDDWYVDNVFVGPGCLTNNDCQNGAFCDGEEICDLQTMQCGPGTAPCVPDGVPCTIDSCNEALDRCDHIPNPTACLGGGFCEGIRICDPILDCLPGTPPDCSDGNACTVDSCNLATDACEHSPDDARCDNGMYCDGIETCDLVLGCQAGTPPNCDDGVACTVDSCDEQGGACVHLAMNGLCDDGVFCNGTETCDLAAGCIPGRLPDCADAVGCTEDSCDLATNTCVHISHDDRCSNSIFCDGIEICDAALDCQPGADPCLHPAVTCDEDLDACTGCTLDADCDDGRYCNGRETCGEGGVCVPGLPPCVDNVLCTLDQCDETAQTCDNPPQDTRCDNGAYCDGSEFCDVLLGCRPGSPPSCDDDAPCTVDACDEVADSCQHAPDHALCNDGLSCNGMEACNPDLKLPGCVTVALCPSGSCCNEDTNACGRIAAAAELAQQDSNAGPGVSLVDLRMNRFIGIRAPGSAGREQAIQVEFVSLPSPWNIWNGTQMFLTEPTTACEAAAVGRGEPCPAGAPTFPLAGLSCDAADAHYRDWSTIPGGVVYVTHPGVVPVPQPPVTAEVPIYEIRMIDSSCDATDGSFYSEAKIVQQVRWGDIAGPKDASLPAADQFTAAEATSASVTIAVDVTALLDKFGNRGGSPIKARADVDPCVPDLDINIRDVSRLLDAFRGIRYPFSPTGGFGCTNPDPCSYSLSSD